MLQLSARRDTPFARRGLTSAPTGPEARSATLQPRRIVQSLGPLQVFFLCVSRAEAVSITTTDVAIGL